MTWDRSGRNRASFAIRIALPTLLAVGLFAATLFAVVVPAYERQILDRKREMIAELTQSAVSILLEYETEERSGRMTRQDAQSEAVARLRFLRYGEQRKDYFWITDAHPRMIMHPYRTDLEGSDLSAFADPRGKFLFVEMVQAVAKDGVAFVEYFWQWKDDPDRIVPKLSHVRAFLPWGWIVGTGIYLEDVREETARLTSHLIRVSLGITAALALLLFFVFQQSLSIEKRRSRAEGSLHESRERYQALVDASTEGIALLLDGRVAFVNPTLLKMLDRRREDLEGKEPSLLFEGKDAPFPSREKVWRRLVSGEEDAPGAVELALPRSDGRTVEAVVSSSRIRIGTREGVILAVREVSPHVRAERDKETLAIELQVALQFLQEPVERHVRELVTCGLCEPVHRAAETMRRARTSAILVVSQAGEPVGIVTDGDLRDRIVAAGVDPQTPVSRIMSAPLLAFPSSGLASEALFFMLENRIRHLAVHDALGRPVGLLRDRELTASQRFSPGALMREIRVAGSAEEIAELRGRVARLVTALVDMGGRPRSVNRILTAVSDTTQERLVALALQEMGPPPARFAFLALGSDGREEQTLATDQDNALLYEDLPDEKRAEADAYFLKLGERVCSDLDRAGYGLCAGGIMAKNPLWNRPLSDWMGLYRGWMKASEPKDLLEFSVFFDFRMVTGDLELARRLRAWIEQIRVQNPPFLLHLARHALEFRLPVGSFGRIATEQTGDHERTFNLKEAMAPIVHVARLYALKHGIEATNTLERLQRLHEADVLRSPSYEEIVQVYEFLMRRRLVYQAQALQEGRAADNHLPTESLTDLDRALLKQASAQISLLLKRVSFDFLGSA